MASRTSAASAGRLRAYAAAARAAWRRSAVNVPNLLSVLRLPMAGAFFVIESTTWRGLLLSVAALSDLLDGWLARLLRQESRAGIILDPLFDKLFVTVVLTAFLMGPTLDWPEYAILLSRDIYISLAFVASRLLRLRVPVLPRLPGKAVTVLQIAATFILLFWPGLAGPFVAVVGLASVVAIVDYTAAGVAAVRGGPRAA